MNFWTPRRILLILAPLYVAIAFGMSACSDLLWDITNGTQGLHARLEAFQPGTTRHPKSYDEVFAGLVSCAQHHAGKMILTNVDLTARGGIWVGNYPQDASTANSVTHALHIDQGVYRDRGVVEHEFAHLLVADFPFLRNPADSLGEQGRFDHRGPFFAACVHYNPRLPGE